MNNEPLVSIILPTYNRVDLLPAAINSVLAQDYQNWELIIWDDGSLDNTRSVIQSYDDARIRYFFSSNHGMSYALNSALKYADGVYLAFLDDDDQWLPQKLMIQVTELLNYLDIDIVFANFINIDLDTNISRIEFEAQRNHLATLNKNDLTQTFHKVGDNFLESLLISNFIAFDTIFIRASSARIVGPFNEKLRNGMDFEFYWRAFIKGMKFAYTDEVLLRRIKSKQSLSRPSIAAFNSSLMALDECYKISQAANMRELKPKFGKSYHRIWQGYIREYAIEGKRISATKAYINSLRYGLSWRAAYLLLGAMAGPKFISVIQKNK